MGEELVGKRVRVTLPGIKENTETTVIRYYSTDPDWPYDVEGRYHGGLMIWQLARDEFEVIE